MATLITGGSGFVGLNIAERILGCGDDVVLASRGRVPGPVAEVLGSLPGGLESVEVDVRDRDAVEGIIRAHSVDRVVHGAAITADEARERTDGGVVVSVNVMGTVSVLEAAAATRVGRFVYLSSSAVYGDLRLGTAPVDEDTPPEPANLYGITKLAAEGVVRRLGPMWGLEVACARIAAAFGPWERHTGVRDTVSPFVGLARLALQGARASVAFGADLDWIYSRDVAEAVAALLVSERLDHYVYDIAPGTVWSVRRFADRLEAEYPGFRHVEASDTETANVVEHTDPERPRVPIGNDRIRELVPGFPRFDPNRAADDYLAWILAHPDYVRRSGEGSPSADGGEE